MSTVEERLTVLERRANRYRNAFVALALTLVGVVLVGATTDDVQEVVRTKALFVMNEAGKVVLYAGTDVDEDGLLMVHSKNGKKVIYAGVDVDKNGGRLVVSNKTGEGVAGLYADEYGNGVVFAANRKGEGRRLQPGP